MQLIMKGYGDLSSLGSYSGTFLYQPYSREEDRYSLTRCWHTCREAAYDEQKTFREKKMRIALYFGFCNHGKDQKERREAYLSYKKQLRRAVRIIHVFERACKLSPLTTVSIYRLHEYNRGYAAIAFFEGSLEWKSNPVMFSMYTLFMRNGKKFCVGTLPKTVDEFVKKYGVHAGPEGAYFSAAKYWEFFIKHRKAILKKGLALPRYMGAKGFFKDYTMTPQHTKFFELWNKDNK
jgi:hypothetical protein